MMQEGYMENLNNMHVIDTKNQNKQPLANQRCNMLCTLFTIIVLRFQCLWLRGRSKQKITFAYYIMR